MRQDITCEGIVVQAGQVWKDLDRRNGQRLCKVKVVTAGNAFMQRCREDGTVSVDTPVKVSVSEMHRGATGWQLVG
ncbi:hypothetical protein [Pseudoduganella sp. R-34]|uniref:hypothetical protein n=1 Tax=Pseudoduganella sp. R-34 TaxID=3404062 RepID=UPI003CFAE1CA